MRKIFVLAVIFSLFFLTKQEVLAKESLVVVEKNGDIVVNVLSAEDPVKLVEDSNLKVKRIASQGTSTESNIRLSKEGEKINLKVGTGTTLDVTKWKDNLVEVEARSDTKLVQISQADGNFLISEGNVAASISFPIIIDPLNGKFLIDTTGGRKYLSVLPLEAARSLLKTKLVSTITNKPLEIVDDEKGLSYVVSGEKVVKILGVYDLKLPLSAKVSAETGEVRSIEDPSWLRFLSVIFV